MGDIDLRAKVENLDYQEGNTISFFASVSPSYVNVGLSVTVACRYNHRIFVGLMPANPSVDGGQGISSDTGSIYIRLLRNGSPIANWQQGTGGTAGTFSIPPTAYWFHDSPGIGTHTYSWQTRRINSGATAIWNWIRTVAYEIKYGL